MAARVTAHSAAALRRNDAHEKRRPTSPIRRWLYRQRKSRRNVHECASLQVGKASIGNVTEEDYGFCWWPSWCWCWVNVQEKKKTKMDTNKKWKRALSPSLCLSRCEAFGRDGWSSKTHPFVFLVLNIGGVLLLLGNAICKGTRPEQTSQVHCCMIMLFYLIWKPFFFFVVNHFHINRPHK